MKKVLVLMSTFNGERYLEEQLRSIFNQKKVDVHVLIRDDGSTDGTEMILNKWAEHENLSWYSGENLKPAYSFLDLIFNAPEYDYYAFSDQDDYWYDDKLYIATSELSAYDDKKAIHVSSCDIVDQDLNIISKREMRFDIPYTLQSTIITRAPSGCMLVFNNQLKKKVSECKPKSIRMHDHWIMLVIEAFKGEVVTNDKSLLKYRQHDNNVVGHITKDYKTVVRRLWKSAIHNSNERQQQAISLYECFGQQISSDMKNELEKVVFYRESWRQTFALLRDSKYRTFSFKHNILFKISVLLRLF